MNNYLIPIWPAPKKIKAFTTTRTGGYSAPPFASFNLGIATGDNVDTVLTNRAKLCNELKLPSEPRWLKQEHTNIVIALNEENANGSYTADAAFTTIPEVICIVQHADCLPILICDKEATIVAAIHAGWRGIATGIIEATIAAMNYNPKKLLVWLGPAIGHQVFTVGAEVREIFIKIDPANNLAFTQHGEKFLANIYLLAKLCLNKLGVRAIYGGEFCTYSEPQRFFSHRREGALSGRMATLIWIGKDASC